MLKVQFITVIMVAALIGKLRWNCGRKLRGDVVVCMGCGQTYPESSCSYDKPVSCRDSGRFILDSVERISVCNKCDGISKAICEANAYYEVCEDHQVCVSTGTYAIGGNSRFPTSYHRSCGDPSNCPCKGLNNEEVCHNTNGGQTCRSCEHKCEVKTTTTTSTTTITTTPSTVTTTSTPQLAKSTIVDTQPPTPDNARECTLKCLNGGTLLKSRSVTGVATEQECCCKCPKNCFGETCDTCLEQKEAPEKPKDYLWLIIILAGVFLLLLILAIVFCCLRYSKCSKTKKCVYPNFPSWPWWNNWWYGKPGCNSPKPLLEVSSAQPCVVDQPDCPPPPCVVEKPCVIEKPCIVEKPTPYVVEKPCILEKEVVIQKPYIVEKTKNYVVEKPRFVDQPCEIEKPQFVEKEVVVEKPRFVEKPVVVEKPKFVEKDVVVEKPHYVEKDCIVERPHFMEKDVTVEKPCYIEKQCIVEKPHFVEKPVIVEKPKFVEKKYTVEKPCFVEKEVVVEKPCFVDKPIMLEKPVIVEKPFVVERPCIVEQPCVVEKARIVNKPCVIKNPCEKVMADGTVRPCNDVTATTGEPRVINSSESWYKPSERRTTGTTDYTRDLHDSSRKHTTEVSTYKPSEMTTYKTMEVPVGKAAESTVTGRDYTDGHHINLDTESGPSEMIHRTTYYKVPQATTKKYYRETPHANPNVYYATDPSCWEDVAATPVHTTPVTPTVYTTGLAPGHYYQPTASHHYK